MKKVNADDKHFRGTWTHEGAMSAYKGQVQVSVSGNKFSINNRWIYDGKTLYEVDSENKQINWMEWKWNPRQIPFWKMAVSMRPFGPPSESGEETMAGRDCVVLRTEGAYQRQKVTLTYWADKEKNVLLKKEHIIGTEKDPILKEYYQCKNIEYDPVFPPDTFQVSIPASYVKVKKVFLGCDFLDNKF